MQFFFCCGYIRLGRHRPVAKKLRDGVMRVNWKRATAMREERVSDWFRGLGAHPVAAKLRLYAQVCRIQLGKPLFSYGNCRLSLLYAIQNFFVVV